MHIPLSDHDLLMIGLARPDAPYASTALSLARAFAGNRRVYYLENPFTWKDVLWRVSQPEIRRRLPRWRGQASALRRLSDFPESFRLLSPPPVWPINWLPSGRTFQQMLALNHRKIMRSVQQVLMEEQVNHYVLLNVFNPWYLPGRNLFPQPALSIYMTVDDISQTPYLCKHGPGLEQRAFDQVDLGMASSVSLQAKYAHLSTPVFHLPNGADTRLFSQTGQERPPELQAETRPVLLYAGAIGIRMDYQLLREVARRHPHKLLLLIGPDTGGIAGSALVQSENVRWIGPKKQHELPPYFEHASCGLIPFRCTQLTQSIYPLKVHEYLAAGLPVVSTDFSPDICRLSPEVFIASGADSFSAAISRAIAAGTDRERLQRRRIARNHSWEAREKSFWEICSRNRK